MPDYIGPQTIQTIPAGELGTTIPTTQQSINFGAGIFEMQKSITTNYCITTGTGAWSAGPINIAAVVTVPDGSSWVIR
jgi:hypothetical protein